MKAPFLLCYALLAAPAFSLPQSGKAQSLDELLEPLRAEYDLPALGGAIVIGEDLRALGAVGVRRVDEEEAVTIADAWHLGSCTKSMTATWIAILVEDEKLSWSTTVGEVYPQLLEAKKMHADWADVPLEWLVQNRSGAPADLGFDGLWGRLWQHPGKPAEQRQTLVEGVLAHAPVNVPGTKYLYSNAGFSIAAAMAETVVGKPWEEGIQEDLFEPLKMKSFGFGAPGKRGKVVQPFGHRERDGELTPVELGPGDDNPSAIAPAGKAHGSLADWAKYAAFHLAGARGESERLAAETFAMLHEPHQGDYAMGWVAREPRWAGTRTLWHNGSNTMWYCEIAIVPEANCALLVTSNRGDGRVREACAETLERLFARARVLMKEK